MVGRRALVAVGVEQVVGPLRLEHEGPAPAGPAHVGDSDEEAGWQAVSSIRKGRFLPEPPENGCPDYCPAVDFCWHYRARKW